MCEGRAGAGAGAGAGGGGDYSGQTSFVKSTFTLEQRLPDLSRSGYWDSQGVCSTGEFGFVGIRIQCFLLKFWIQKVSGFKKFPDSW